MRNAGHLTRLDPRLAALATILASACSFPPLPPIDGDAGPIDAAITCTPSTTTCADGMLVDCDAEGTPTVTACGFGCAASGDRCADLAPSNGLGSYLDQAGTAGVLQLSGDAIIDTTSGRVTNGDGSIVGAQVTPISASPVGILVVTVSSFTAHNVAVRGSRALALVADGDVTLTGVLSVSASKEVAGPGALDTTPCAVMRGSGTTSGGSGGGGGGYGSAGGNGGTGGAAIGPMGGSANGNDTITPLRGGCPGGAASATVPPSPVNGYSGQGGGAVQIVTRGRVVLSPGARVAANGSGAASYTGTDLLICNETNGIRSCHQGAGGGSGGSVLIEARSLEVNPSSGVVANGGAGHCGFNGKAPDGRLDELAAAGTDCSSIGNTGAGGNGGSAAGPPSNGGLGGIYGGGGGGGYGRVRLNLTNAATFDPGPAVFSPTPSLGSPATR